MNKKKLYSLLNFWLINMIVLTLGIVYAMKGDGANTSTLFGAGMISLTIVLYLLTWPILFKLLYLENKSNFLSLIIIFGFLIFPIALILISFYIILNFDQNESARIRKVKND